MPVYSYDCDCGSFDAISKYEDRDAVQCDTCKRAVRQPVQQFNSGKPAYQMQAIMGNGDHVKGHFGKTAKNKWRSTP